MSQSTLRLAGEAVRATPLGGRALKGFSSEVEVYGVESIDPAVAPVGLASTV